MHPDDAHALKIQLATALRERDEALAQETYWHNRASEARDERERAREQLTAAESERDALRAALEKHGCHEVECDANKEEDDQFCTCGLAAALASGGDRG